MIDEGLWLVIYRLDNGQRMSATFRIDTEMYFEDLCLKVAQSEGRTTDTLFIENIVRLGDLKPDKPYELDWPDPNAIPVESSKLREETSNGKNIHANR